MDQQNSQPTGDSSQQNPRSDARGMAGYTPRQANYFSAVRPTSQPVTLAESSEAAQRIVMPDAPATEPVAIQPQPVQPVTPTASAPARPVSFDMLPTRPAAPQQAQPTFAAQPQPATTPEFATPPAAATNPQIISQPKAPALPTDLPLNFAELDTPGDSLKKHGKIGLNLSNLANLKVASTVIVLVVLSSAVFGFLKYHNHNEQSLAAQVKSAVTGNKQDNDGGMTSGTPNENGNAPSVEYYKTAYSYPRVLRIDKLSTEARVLALNIAPTGALKAPATIFDAGWYKDSAKPGEQGAMVIDGHAMGDTKPGIFKNLGALVKGDTIEVERGDGQKFTYTVMATKVYEADNLDMSSVMVPVVPGKPGLNLLTCNGKFDETTNKYPPRTVVYAVMN